MYKTFFADEKWNSQLCDLMRSESMPGTVEIIYSRDPDFFKGAKIQGKHNRIIITTKDNKIVLTMTISSKEVYINRKPFKLGYLNSLRIHKSYRNTMLLGTSFKFFKKTHNPEYCPFYFATIINSNIYAKNILLRDRKFWINNIYFGKYFTYAILIKKRIKIKNKAAQIKCVRGNQVPLSKIIEFLNKNGKEKQFYPVYKTADFNSSYCSSFVQNDFYITLENNKITGIIGKWDLENIKQNTLSKYSGILKMAQPLLNKILKIAGFHPLPSPGGHIKHFYLSFVCIKDNKPDLLKILIDKLLSDNSNYHLCMLGLHEKDPLRKVMKNYFSIKYTSCLYGFYFNDGRKIIDSLDPSLIPYLELATL